MGFFLKSLMGTHSLLVLYALFSCLGKQVTCIRKQVLKRIFNARVAKRAKVMFSQAFVCPSPGGGGGGSVANQMQHGTRSEHLPPAPLGPGQNVYPHPPPWGQVRMSTSLRDQVRRSTSPLGPGQNVYPLPRDQVRMSTPSPPWDQVRMSTPSPPGPGQNVYPPGTRSECLPCPPLRDQVRMSTPPGTRLEGLPPPGTRSEYLPPPHPPGARSECLPPPRDQVRMSTPSPRDQVRMSTPSPPETRSECLPRLGPGQNVYPVPSLGPGQNVYPPSGTRS